MSRSLIAAASLIALATPAPALAQEESPSVLETASTTLPEPPVADRRPHSFTMHGITVEDPYHWMKDQGYPEIDDADVLEYLNQENTYFEAVMEPHQALIDTLYTEMRGRIPENDASVPIPDGDYEYWYAYNEGQEYRLWYRRPLAGGGDELLLDENALAEGHEQFSLGTVAVSPDARLLAYSTDTDGSERFVLRFRDLATGEDLPDTIPDVNGGVVWAADSASIVYTPVNENWRTEVAMHHVLGTEASADREIYRETEEGMQLGIDQTQSRRFLTINAGDNVSNEVRLVPLADLTAEPVLVSPRETNRQYSVEEREDTLYILVNDTHVNFRAVTAPVDAPGTWTELIAGSDALYLTGLTTFADFYVLELRERGLDQVEIRGYDDEAIRRVEFPEASYDAGLGPVAEFDVDAIRIDYESMVTPETDYSYDLASGELTALKVQQVPSGYDASQYATERLEIEARDGAMVPVSLVYRRDTEIGPDTPVHLYAYGAYGYAIPPSFSTRQLSLTNRGFIFAIAHIRGGDDLGYQWYLDGKLERRNNTFNDFVDVARGLIARGYTSAGRIAASGGSAGGELMGVVANTDPELWGAVVAEVPFVDVLNTMLDESLPLTPGEWPEWGNPITDPDAFRLIQSYSPYDNVSAQDYPPIMVTAGLNDPRVTYWEPAKWTARLRATRTDDDLTVLRTNMGAGHRGQSGRFQVLREEAQAMAFMLTQLGVEE
ncbi:S9 family peptidase [Parasphingopyxis algicola]|uniref:S9 family peptidase n=1 Tax=Parasphingopyxis algicola TaxID=2026624 RepID=UPI0015A1F183|nr:S9 family peptidase [Parasphingopyxis algicola]QLC25984.1 S9 family peptidase [Parasphingopyxis algicola]